jgi:hypothetical protein
MIWFSIVVVDYCKQCNEVGCSSLGRSIMIQCISFTWAVTNRAWEFGED